MSNYKKSDLSRAFKKLGIKKNDSIFLSTSLGMLGIPKTKNKNLLLESSKWILKTVQDSIGETGNLFVPTYSYTLTKKYKIFNPKTTKADIGYFPNFFLKQKNILRSKDPMMSIAGIGPDAKKILNGISNSSFGKNCVLERLLNLKNLKCCNIGLGYNWIPFIHYLDWKNNVPFRFNKIFTGSIKERGKIKKVKWNYFARYMRKETTSNGYKIGKLAVKKKLYNHANVGKSLIYVTDYRKFYNFSLKLSKKNKWITVDGPPFRV